MPQMSRGEIQDLLGKFAANNPKYRDQMIKDPKSVLEKQLNTSLPANLKVKAVEETADTIYVVVPFIPKAGQELGDSALEMVAGGFKDENYNCNEAKGGLNTRIEFKLA